MNCQEFWEGYPELSPKGPEGHAADCPACARLLAEQQTLAVGLRAAALKWREVEAPPRVEAGLLAAFRSQHAYQPRQRRMWWPVLTWATAAAILIVFAAVTIRGRGPAVAPRTIHRTVELAAVPATTDWSTDEDANSGEFIPLPNAQQVADGEDLNVVRMEVPRSAMLALGLTVSMDRVSDLVEADVMVGSDGLARAVRFVDE